MPGIGGLKDLWMDTITANLITRCLYKLCPRWRQTRLQTEKETRISGLRFCPFFAPGHVRARSHSHQSATEQMALLLSDISSSSLSL